MDNQEILLLVQKKGFLSRFGVTTARSRVSAGRQMGNTFLLAVKTIWFLFGRFLKEGSCAVARVTHHG